MMGSPGLCGGALFGALAAALCGCAGHAPEGARDAGQSSGAATTAPTPERYALSPLFEHVRIDPSARLVEFDAAVSPILLDDPRSPLVYLEVLVCIPGTREHETLLVSKAKASEVHAALLAVGLQPGSPGGFSFDDNSLKPIRPTGPAVRVTFEYDDRGVEHAVDPLAWVVNAADGSPFLDTPLGTQAGFVFAGSRFVRVNGDERYAGDLGGNIIGLTTFGDEVVALSTTISPEAAVQAPEWVAKLPGLPPPGTPVRVRIKG